ncbi:hypothetical protein AB0F96_22045 [Streptomyces sp. NPDC023998]|uniref:hypothetical protein n=1 Tax=Streptomyces sp. NPDC023998 TaxID=3154597 RepID=UPI00341121D8
MAQILQWVERNSLSMAAWEDPRKVDEVLHALATKLDGTTAAASSVKRTHRILNVALEYAVTHKVLSANPLPKGRGTTPKTSSAVDKRALINLAHAAGLLGWIWHRPRGGQRLHAFFATMYYAGPRPEEVVAMRVLDAQLPDADAEDQWGELLFHTAQPEVGNRGLTPPESSPHILRSHPQKPCHSCTAPDHRSRAVRRLCREHCAWGGGRSSSHAPHAPLALLATDRPCFAALNCAERMIPFPIRIASS